MQGLSYAFTPADEPAAAAVPAKGLVILDTMLFSVERNLATLDLVSALLNSSISSCKGATTKIEKVRNNYYSKLSNSLGLGDPVQIVESFRLVKQYTLLCNK